MLSADAKCFEFYYYSAGTNADQVSLDVIYTSGSDNEILWSQSGDEGNQWNKVTIGLPARKDNYQVNNQENCSPVLSLMYDDKS